MRYIFCLLLFLFSLEYSGYALDITTFVPNDGELSPNIITLGPQTFSRDNLWEYINGAAPSYLNFGFKQVVTFIVMNTDSTEAVVDIYDMADSLNAFGMFAQERSAKGKPVSLGSGAVSYSNSINFWQNRYYVKLVAYTALPGTIDFLNKLGTIISAKMPGGGSLPRYFSLFPKQGKIPGSEKYYAQDIFGENYLQKGYSIEYVAGDEKYIVFIIPFSNEQEAREKFTTFRNRKSPVNPVSREITNTGDDAFMVKDSYYGTGFYVLQRNYMIGVLGNIDDMKTNQVLYTIIMSMQIK